MPIPYPDALERFKSLPPDEQKRKLPLLSPGLQNYIRQNLGEPEKKKHSPGWQTVLKAPLKRAGAGLNWVQEEIVEPQAASLTAPFHEGIGSIWKPAATLGATGLGFLAGGPAGAGIAGSAVGSGIGQLDKGTEESYDKWKSPKFVKGAAEILQPSSIIPARAPFKGAAVLSKAAGAGKLGKGLEAAARGVDRVENLPGDALSKVLRAAKPAPALRPVAERVIADPEDFQSAMQRSFRPDNYRTLANSPGLRKFFGTMSPAAVANDPLRRTLLARGMQEEWAHNATKGLMATVDQEGDLFKVFPDMEADTWRIAVKGEKVPLGDIQAQAGKYDDALTDAQRRYIEGLRNITRDHADFVQRNGVPIKRKKFAEDWEYDPHIMLAKKNADGSISEVMTQSDYALRRKHNSHQELLDLGWLDMNPRDAVEAIVLAGYRRVLDKQMSDYLLKLKPNAYYRPLTDAELNDGLNAVGAIEFAKLLPQKERARFNALIARYNGEESHKVSQRVLQAVREMSRGGVPAGATMASIRQVHPELAQKMADILTIKAETFERGLNQVGEGWGDLPKFKTALQDIKISNIKKANEQAMSREVAKGARQPVRDVDEATRSYFEDISREVVADGETVLTRLSQKIESNQDAITLLENAITSRKALMAKLSASASPEGLDQKIYREFFDNLKGKVNRQTKEMRTKLRELRLVTPAAKRELGLRERIETIKASKKQRVDTLTEKLSTAKKRYADSLGELKERMYTADEVHAAFRQLDIPDEKEIALLNRIYKAAGETARKERWNEIQKLTPEVKSLVEATRINRNNLRRIAEAEKAKVVQPSAVQARLQDVPAFHNIIISKEPGGMEVDEIVEIIKHAMKPDLRKGLDPLNKIKQVNDVARIFVLGGDTSIMTIQLLFMAGAKPGAYRSAMKGYAKAFVDPDFRYKYYAEHRATINSSPNLILAGGGRTEFTEGYPLLERVVGHGPLKPFAGFLNRTKIATETALDIAGIEMKEAFQHMAIDPATGVMDMAKSADIDDFINEFRGLASSSRLGVHAEMRQMESVTMLAPRYNRAIAALLADLFRGGIRGELARKNMAKGVGALAAMTVAIGMTKAQMEGKSVEEAWEDIADHLDPANPKFMTWNIAGQNIGPGSKVRSVIRLWGKMEADPNHIDSALWQFARGNLSPVGSTGYDLLTGRDYIGNPTRDGVLQLTDTVIAQNLTPIWFQGAVMEPLKGEADPNLLRAGAELTGMRVYPITDAQKRTVMRNDYANETFKKNWDELNNAEKNQVTEKHSDLRDLHTRINKDLALRKGSLFDKAYYVVNEAIAKNFADDMTTIAAKMMAGRMSWGEYNDERKIIMAGKFSSRTLAVSMKEIMDSDSIRDLENWIAEHQKPEDAALEQFQMIMANNPGDGREPRKDEYGMDDWETIFADADVFLMKQPASVREYIQQHRYDWMKALPPGPQQVEIERMNILKTLGPYLSLKSKILKTMTVEDRRKYEAYMDKKSSPMGKYGPEWGKMELRLNPMLRYIVGNVERQLEANKERLKMKPEVAQAVSLWYAR